MATVSATALSSVSDDPASVAEPGAATRPIEALISAARLERPDFAPTSVSIKSDPAAPAKLAAGRSGALFVNRYTGEVLGEGATELEAFFRSVTGWHRWFNAEGENRRIWRAITGASNLAFLFLILSGLYLWLPRVMRWPMLKARLLLDTRPRTSHARDFNWHHVFGIWIALPLTVVVATATVFSYRWVNDLLYRSFGETPPAARAGRRPATPPSPDTKPAMSSAGRTQRLSLDALLDIAARQHERWNDITLQLPGGRATEARGIVFTIDQGNGRQPQRRHTLTLDAANGEVLAREPFSSLSPARRARSWVRFMHTGEALGVVGQTVAGAVSAVSAIMVWTGLALAYRRLIRPMLRRRRSHAVEPLEPSRT